MAETTELTETEEKKHEGAPTFVNYLTELQKQMGKSAENVLGPEGVAATTDADAATKKKKEDEDAAAAKIEADKKSAEAATLPPATVVKVVKRDPPPPPPPAPVAQLPQVPEPTATELAQSEQKKVDEEYIKGLNKIERRDVEVARYAESKGLKGMEARQLKYFRDLDKLQEEHPDWTPNTEEYKEFVAQNNPFKDEDFISLLTDMKADQRANQVEEKIRKDNAPLELQVREMKLQPVIDREVNRVDSILTTEDKELPGIDKAIIDRLDEVGYQEALKEFPIEAPWIASARQATDSWLRVANGIKAFNPNDEVDKWMVKVLHTEHQRMLASPKEAALVNGKNFVPAAEYARMGREAPHEIAKVWTVSDTKMTELIARAARSELKAHSDMLTQSVGWERKAKKVVPNNDNKSVPPLPAATTSDKRTSSPMAGARSLPGAVESEDKGFSALRQLAHMPVVLDGMK